MAWLIELKIVVGEAVNRSEGTGRDTRMISWDSIDISELLNVSLPSRNASVSSFDDRQLLLTALLETLVGGWDSTWEGK